VKHGRCPAMPHWMQQQAAERAIVRLACLPCLSAFIARSKSHEKSWCYAASIIFCKKRLTVNFKLSNICPQQGHLL
jgi:hypothetical protein